MSLINATIQQPAGVKIVHTGIPATDGIIRALAVLLTCDSTGPEKPTLKFVGESKTGSSIVYSFSGTTKLVCPILNSEANSSVFLSMRLVVCLIVVFWIY